MGMQRGNRRHLETHDVAPNTDLTQISELVCDIYKKECQFNCRSITNISLV